MMKKILKQMMMVMLTVLLFGVWGADVYATQTEDTAEEEAAEEETAEEEPELTFEIANFTYVIHREASPEDMPPGFSLGNWRYQDELVKAGFTPNSNMVCVMASDVETGYEYRFIYDSNCDLFVPYFGTEVEDGYIYTVPMYEDAEIPYGFVESYFVIQTVPMFVYMREDAELTQEEIAVGSLSEDNYLVFLMMDENGKEIHYTYDLIDRTFQRSLLQKKDAEKVTELNEVIDELHAEIGILNSNNAERMNGRLTLIGILIAVVVIMAGIMVNLILQINHLKNGEYDEEEKDEEDDDDETFEEEVSVRAYEYSEEPDEATPVKEDNDDWEIIDLDLEDE